MTVTGKRYVDCTVLETGNTGDGEDSSYDSDYEAEDSIGSITTHSQLELQVSSSSHFDVSRTTSDTLAAEFAEYVTVQESAPPQTPGYAARVEFALKLGYTERLVQAALQKLGPDPEQNELLAELIRLGANCPQKLSDSPEEANGILDGDITSDEGGGCSLNSSVLRPIVIDGSNVAMSHGNKEVFSCRGIKICVDWFRSRGHKEITVFVPKWRKEASRLDNPIADQEILGELEKDRLLVFTPSRLVGGKRMVCYDDRYILRLAAEVDGIVVSNDNYRDLAQESPEFRKVVEERILMYSFVNDRFMPPDDPLGRSGPTLENFLRVSSRKNDPPAPPCPYAKKCTYGNKCKFRHPERGPQPQKSVTERLVEHAQRHLQARGPSLSLPLPGTSSSGTQCPPLCKTRSLTSNGTSQSLASVTKSKSAENVTSDQSVSAWGYGQSLAAGQNNQGYRSSTRQAGRTNNPEGDPPNTHRKLQRQLTLNPVFDPRLYQLRRYHQQSPQTSSSSPSTSTNQQSGICTTGVPHKPLTRHSSNEYPVPMSWGPTESSPRHQHVARIASAPESYQFWPPRSTNQVTALPQSQQRLAISDPQLRPVTSYPVAASPVYMGSRFTADRTRALDQLCLIFPDEYVNIVMNMHPYVTDPKVVIPILKEMTVPLSMPRYKH